ncbi:MAG: CocE/NonD family hydrolase [Chloroflexi bacterium]|nr:CocE/NonD family hydrolase [Chloroflexota bacterium]
MQTAETSIVVELDVAVPMRDGTRLRANVYRPPEGRWPVLLTRLPYGKDLPLGTSVLDPVQAARRGYVVIVQDTRGRLASEGEWQPFVTEADDGVDTIAWAAELPYADGQVGMFGTSYFGFTQWAAAVHNPPALKAMVPFLTWCDPLNGLAFRGGALELGTTAHWGLLMGLDGLLRRFRTDQRALGAAIVALCREIDQLGPSGYAALPLAEFGPLRRQPVLPAFFDRIARPMNPAPLEALTIAGKHDRVQVPTFNVGGWFDIFLADTIANYDAMRRLGRPTKLLIGPWTHAARSNPVGELNFGFGAQLSFINLQADFGRLQLRWFDHWLKGIDTNLLAEAPIRLFVMGANVWRDEHEWPLQRAHTTPFYLRSNAELSTEPPATEPPDTYSYDPRSPVPTHGGALLMAPEFPTGPVDQRTIEARPDVLTFTTPPLEHDTEVTGPVRVQLWASSSAPDTDFVARLVDVYPDGRAYNLTDGIIRARFRDGGAASLLEPGRPYLFDIDLWATSNVFKAGHRIRLQVCSSNFPRWDRNPNTGHAFGQDDELSVAQQSILHDAEHPSHVLLPVVPD